jgi:hypothetical protein
MLRLIRLPVELENMILEAQSESMRRLFEAWDKEIEAHAKALIEENQRKAEQAAHEAAIASSLEVYLRGLLYQAQTGDDVSLSIPTGIRVASSIAGGPSIDSLAALAEAVSEADDTIDPSQRSAAWALGHGYMPHPSDLSAILGRLAIDGDWADRFAELGAKIDQADQSAKGLVQLQVNAGQTKLSALDEQVRLLDAYGSNRLFRLVADPRSLQALGRTPPLGGKTPASAIDAAMKSVQ